MLYLKNLTYHPAAAAKAILADINLEMPAQQLGLIIGPSGSGKSTLLEILAGLAQQTKGEIYWRDQALTNLHLQQLAGLVFQFPERHFCGGTILEELRLGHPELGTERVFEALKEVGLEHLSLRDAPQSLSGGQQRRLALAVQLIRQPNVLLLDEPTAGLDWSMRRQVISLLARLKAHWSILIVTHEASDLLPLADCCWTLAQGRLTSVAPESLAKERPSQVLSTNTPPTHV